MCVLVNSEFYSATDRKGEEGIEPDLEELACVEMVEVESFRLGAVVRTRDTLQYG